MLDLNKYSNSDKSQILHTSGYARVGRGTKIGSTSNQTFQQRIEMTQQERTIAGYRRSAIGAQRGSLRAKQATPESTQIQRRPVAGDKPAPIEGRQAAIPSRPSGFVEPSSRGYNPFS